MLVLLAVVVITGPLVHDHPERGFTGWTVIALTSLAMGVQTEAIRHVAGVAITTTYESGALVRVGEMMSAPFRQGASLAVLVAAWELRPTWFAEC